MLIYGIDQTSVAYLQELIAKSGVDLPGNNFAEGLERLFYVVAAARHIALAKRTTQEERRLLRTVLYSFLQRDPEERQVTAHELQDLCWMWFEHIPCTDETEYANRPTSSGTGGGHGVVLPFHQSPDQGEDAS